MSLVEKLLQGINARFSDEQRRRESEIAAAIAKSSGEDTLVRRREELERGSFFDPKERQKIEAALKRFSVRERLEAIRDGVWTVGEVSPSHMREVPPYNPPVLNGYSLEYRYPALVHTDKPVAFTEFISRPKNIGWDFPAPSGMGGGGWSGGSSPIYGAVVGEKVDYIKIGVIYPKDAVYISAASRVEVDSTGKARSIDPPNPFDKYIYDPKEAYYYLHPIEPHNVLGFDITTPNMLEELLVDWCYKLTKLGRLPLQSQKTKEEIEFQVDQENQVLRGRTDIIRVAEIPNFIL